MPDNSKINPGDPTTWSDDPYQQGRDERGYGNGTQKPWQSGESYDDFQKRTNPPAWEK